MARPPTRTAPPPPGQRRARRMPAAARRETLLDAASALFAERGFAATGTADIARRAGVGEPTLYRHFPSKRALHRACLDRASVAVLERWRAIAADHASPRAALDAVGAWYLEQLGRRPDLLVLRHRAFLAAEDPELAGFMRSHYAETFDFVRGLFERARDAGELPADADVEAHAWMFMALGAVLDQTHVLGLRDRLDPALLRRMRRLLTPPPEETP